ncbi:hypothetical protein KUCAC02_004538, partial [Chaenocephalus aceratus]
GSASRVDYIGQEIVNLSSHDAPADSFHLLVLLTQPTSDFNEFPPDRFLPPGVCRGFLPGNNTGNGQAPYCRHIVMTTHHADT